MFTYPNFLSLLRIPLAFVFLQENPFYRALAIVGALLTDGLDGYVARHFNQKGRIGTVLDPLTDKFFVFFVLFTLIGENRISFPEALILICRDFSVILYGFYLAWRGRLFAYQFGAIWCRKNHHRSSVYRPSSPLLWPFNSLLSLRRFHSSWHSSLG